MEQSGAMYRMSVQQNIPPAPNEDPRAVDWLPLFAGFSWLAYGAHFSVVITMAPSPSNTGEAAMGGFFQQVLLTDCPKHDDNGRERVSRVAWAPRGLSIGSLGAAAGKNIFMYEPRGLCSESGKQSLPEVPLRWVNTQTLRHFSEVFSFAWSESGDGLLSVGMEAVMWLKIEETFICLWRSHLENPHSLSSASWSARGIAASAEGAMPSTSEEQENNEDRVVKIWWWEDGKELQEVELSHPNRLVSIQWRPMRDFGSSSPSFRPVLLTCCQDGVVRLWAEIGNLGFPDSENSGLTNLDPATATNQGTSEYDAQFKLAFFVSAVIDVNSILKGVLGLDIHVTWPEVRGGNSRTSSSYGDGKNSVVTKEAEVPTNEWLVGVGPSGSITLWSVQSLDDLSPARGPLLQLCHQRSGLLPVPSMPHLANTVHVKNSLSVKVEVHRPHGTSWGPPSSLDVFETWSPHLLRWSCIWPPVSAIGGRNSKPFVSNPGLSSGATPASKVSPWGVSSESLFLGGHNGNIRQVAVHPIAETRLVASVDDLGMVLLWISNGSSTNPRLDINGFSNPLWKLCGQLTGHRVNRAGPFNSMAWVPVVLPGEDAVLLLCHPCGVDFLLISRDDCISKGKLNSLYISHKILHSIDWPSSDYGQTLQGIYSFPLHTTVGQNPQIRSCMAVGIGNTGLNLASWKVDIKLHHYLKEIQASVEDVEASMGLDDLNVKEDSEVGKVSVEAHEVVSHEAVEAMDSEQQTLTIGVQLLGFTTLFARENVTSISVRISNNLSARTLAAQGDYREVFDVVTGCADGAMRLWKVWDESFVTVMNSVEKAPDWQCVGIVRFYNGPVCKVALFSGGAKFASVGRRPDGEGETLHIWGPDTFVQDKGFCLEGVFHLPQPAVSLTGLDGGNGSSILGVATENDVQLFAEFRLPFMQSRQGSSLGLSGGSAWTCLVSSSLTGFTLRSLSWETQGSLIVTSGGHFRLYNNCFLSQTCRGLNTTTSGVGSSKASIAFKGHSETLNDLWSYQTTPQKYDKDAQSVGRIGDGDYFDHEEGLCSILDAAEKIGRPVLDYHPISILSWIAIGKRQHARACIRNLATSLISLSSSSSLKNYFLLKPKISCTPLSEIFQDREQFYSSKGRNTPSTFALAGNAQSEGGRIPDFISSSLRDSFVDFSTPLNNDFREKGQSLAKEPNLVIKSGGFEFLTTLEVEVITNLVKDSLKIPGLSGYEKIQLLAIIDVLAEMDGISQPSQVDSIDLPGQRFWLAFRYSFLEATWNKGSNPDVKDTAVDSKAMAWALQSEFKEILLELCLPDHGASWSAMRALGVGYWFTDSAQLRTRMEKVARAQYLEKKDPKDCALLYLALDRRSVLAGLFKLTIEQKDRPLADFLLRDFKEERNKVAALKNAYVLMGKHRHQLAASFFILGGDLSSAAVVCAKNLGDIQLSLVILSLLEGTSGPIGRDIILKYALPAARQAKDGWFASLLQWLLGNGIESLQELSLQSHNLSNPSPQRSSEFSEGSKVSPLFPLDYDTGSYCTLLASKSRVRTGADAVEASSMARIATMRSATALRRSGLCLQTLEYLRHTQIISPMKGDCAPCLLAGTATGSAPCIGVDLTDISGRAVGLGWFSSNVVSGIQMAARANLVLLCASQLLQNHPHWGSKTWTPWQDLNISENLSRQKESVNEAGSSSGSYVENAVPRKKEWGLSLAERADNLFHDDIQLLTKKYMLNVDEIIGALSTFARIHHRPYILHRLVQGLMGCNESSDMRFCLASKSAMSVSASHYLMGFATSAPRVLARAVLASGGSAATVKVINLEESQGKCRNFPGRSSHPDEGSALPWSQVEELVRFGGEIQFLTTAATQGNPFFDKERGARPLTLLSFVFFLTAAWLGRQTKTLFTLLSPTVIDPSQAPEVPQGEFDAVTWFQKLELAKSSPRSDHRSSFGKGPPDSIGFNQAGRVTISSDNAWRLLGITLWTHLLIFVRKQLTGAASDPLYSSFGRMSSSQSQLVKSSLLSSQSRLSSTSNTKGSTFLGFNLQPYALSSSWLDFKSKVLDSYHTQHSVNVTSKSTRLAEGDKGKLSLNDNDGSLPSTTDTGEFGAALLSSLTSIVAGLRKQLAAHLEYSLDSPELDPLSLWLWGKPSLIPAKIPNQGSNASTYLGASTSNGTPGTGGIGVVSQQGPNIFPTAVIETEDEVLKELWELLVVRERVCSALGLEGVSGQRIKQEIGKMSGWYIGRQGATTAIPIESGVSYRDVNTTAKLPPKRIMWNAVKGVSPVLDQGVTHSSRLQEENDQSKTHASEDGLHLSEEFSEVDPEDHFPTVKRIFSRLPGILDQRHGSSDLCSLNSL